MSYDPKKVAEWVIKSNLLLMKNQLKDGIYCCDKAIILDSQNAGAWTNKAAFLLRKGNFNNAVVCCDKALAINPRFALA